MKTKVLRLNCMAIVIALWATLYVAAADLTDGRSGPDRQPAPLIRDVQLHQPGTLFGALIDSQGAPVANKRVSIRQQAQVLTATESDENGRFVVRGIRGGVYQIEAYGGSTTLRAWAPGTAPPSAEQGVLIVADGEVVVRGQGACGCAGPCSCGSPAWFEAGPLINKCHVQGALWGGVITGVTYWVVDYNKSGS